LGHNQWRSERLDPPPAAPEEVTVQIVILLYPDMTALDAIGPYEVLARLPGATLCFAAEAAGPITTDTGFLTLEAERGLSEIASADLLLLPGGPGDAAVRENAKLLDEIRRLHAGTRFTTSVCTGSLILGAAGLLDGLRATTHWTQLEALREYGALPTSERVVEQGRIVTAAGVSAGIDMALQLTRKIVGDDYARALQLGIEYDPQPPFDCGSPEKAPPAVVELVKATMAR
jgi:transcriptional regulator GlxA family with amidase domain